MALEPWRPQYGKRRGSCGYPMINRKGIHPNLDYPAGLAYHLMGFDIPAFTPIFVMSRITG